MIKLLIADDEPFIRKGIRSAIPWHEHDIEVVGEASNGKEALQLALQLEPDIVLADIQMPVLTGLELAKQIGELLPQTRVIILTAYNSTANLESAIKNQVSRFILKNASCTDILDNVLEVCKDIEHSREVYSTYKHLNDVYNENQHLIRSTLVSRYLTRQLSYSDFIEKLQAEHLSLPGPYYAILVAECSERNDWRTINAFKTAFADWNPFMFFIKDSELIILLNTDINGLSSECLSQILPDIRPYVYTNQLVLINGLENLNELPAAYTDIQNCLDYCFWNTDQDFTIITSAYALRSTKTEKLPLYEKEIVTALLSGSNKEIENALGHYYDFCRNTPISKSVFLDSIRRLILLIASLQSENFDIEAAISYLYDLETPLEILQYLESLVMPNLPSLSQMPQIIDALSYIHTHYAEDIHLNDVARSIALSAGYLSRIFKAETGYSFTEYIHHVRIEEAKKLISSTNLKYYEIAEMVGYKDYKSFAAYFNKHCGCSAKEYKNKYHKNAKPD